MIPSWIRRGLLTALLILGFSSLAEASKRIVVDLTHQIAIAYQDGKVKFYGRISTGKPGRETPTGSYHVREKDIDHVSNLWPQPNGGAKMHYMLRITRDGVAMHLGNTPSYPASHGCIRMQDGFAQRMYAWAEKWTKVDIIGHAPAHSPAVALPAYARSARILNRSIGGGNRGPLAAIGTNKKSHNRLSNVASKKRTSTREAKARHSNPLHALDGKTKRRTQAKKEKRRSTSKHRRPTKRRPHHTNPLEAVSGN